jgi:23S rRNA maturation mini-RNase III
MDTMKDLILNTIGSGFAAILGYLYLKKGRQFLLNGVIDDFVIKNPRLFYK